MKLPSFLRQPSLEERSAKELSDARISRLAASSQREYFVALQSMYEQRIIRLEQEMAFLLDDSNVVHVIGGNR